MKLDVNVLSGQQGGRVNKFKPWETEVEKNSLSTAPKFILVTAPSERKVCYTQVEDVNAALMNKVFPLIDGGLIQPKGLAYDKQRSLLYVADLDARRVMQYEIRGVVHTDTLQKGLKTVGTPIVIVQDADVRWVTVDDEGNLYWSEQASNSVNKLKREILSMLKLKTINARELMRVSEAQAAAEEESLRNAWAASGGAPAAPPLARKIIIQLFDRWSDPHVSRPNGVWVHGSNLYWTNGAGDQVTGSVAKGKNYIEPNSAGNGALWQLSSDAGETVNPMWLKANSTLLANNVNQGFGIETTDNYVVYTDVSTNVFAKKMGEDSSVDPIVMTNAMQTPRGVVWDGDGTIYVADSSANAIYALPSATKVPRVPEMVVGLHGAYGLAFASGDDPGLIVEEYRPPSYEQPDPSIWCMLAPSLFC